MDRNTASFWQQAGEILAADNTNDEQKRSEIRAVLDQTDSQRLQACRDQYRLIGLAFETETERTERERQEAARTS